jgi:Mg2+-importing ATPase
MITFGLVSTAFDLLTFAMLRMGFGANATEFRSAWFLESVCTELAVLFVLRTRRPFYRSRPSPQLLLASAALALVALALPFLPVAPPLGLGPVAPEVLAALALIVASYIVTTELVKHWFYGRGDASAGRRVRDAAA